MDSLREDLDHLVHSPGWSRFLEHVEREWGSREKGGGVRFTQAAHQAANIGDEINAVNQLRQICVAQREIHNLLSWVETTLKQATKEDRELVPVGAPDYSRRGGL
ncbi:MAG TPA: hypothetical protein VD994_18305 [Prosthecobacter sp.]|nr:hypothetical protein [Prosthecobacter sp.]